MPYSPIKKFPAIIQNLRSAGNINEVTIERMEVAVMAETGSIKDRTIADIIRAMVRMGFTHRVGDFVFCIRQGCSAEKHNGADPEAEADRILGELSKV